MTLVRTCTNLKKDQFYGKDAKMLICVYQEGKIKMAIFVPPCVPLNVEKMNFSVQDPGVRARLTECLETILNKEPLIFMNHVLLTLNSYVQLLDHKKIN